MAGTRDIQAGRASVRMGLDDSELIAGLRRTGRRVQRFGQDVARMGTTLLASGVLIGSAFLKGLQTFADFDSVMRTVEATTGATASQIALLRAEAERLGASTSYAASEVSNLQLTLSRSGFSVTEIVAATEAILKLAKASGVSLDDASSTAATTLRQFNLAASQTGRVVDVLAKAAASSNVTVLSLSEALKEAGPAGAAAGLSIEQVVALVGKLGDAGIAGSKAGTALKGIFGQLAGQADLVQDLFGVSTVDAAGNLKPARQALEEIGVALKSLTQQEQAVRLEKVFGREAKNAALILAGSGGLGALEQALIDSEGAADKAVNTIGGGLTDLRSKAQSAGEAIRISLGKAVEPLAKKFLITLGDVLTRFNEFIKANDLLVRNTALFTAPHCRRGSLACPQRGHRGHRCNHRLYPQPSWAHCRGNRRAYRRGYRSLSPSHRRQRGYQSFIYTFRNWFIKAGSLL